MEEELPVLFTKSINSCTVGLAIIALFTSACATPVGVKRIDERAAHRELNANILSAGRPSQYSTQFLERNALSGRFKRDPEFVLAELNSGLGKPDEHDRLFALSELSFGHAEDSGKESYYLASAIYAYAFLFPANPTDAPGPYDPRLSVAVDLYDSGIALGLATKDGKQVDLSGRQLELPFGSLSLEDNLGEFKYAGNQLTKFVSLDELNQMVVIGHSQGGLLTKMTVVDSGTRFWNIISNVPFDKAKLDPETRDLLARALFVKPLPFVTRVVFIATPQRGSYMASNYFVKFGNKLINLPGGWPSRQSSWGSYAGPVPWELLLLFPLPWTIWMLPILAYRRWRRCR
jgi:hypothetical protein